MAIPDRGAKPGWKLYESAVIGFYQAVLPYSEWRVRPQRKFEWPLESSTAIIEKMMPGMISDIVLEHRDHSTPHASRRIVIDTKFSSMITSGQHGNQSLRPGNIYQIYAYLRSQEKDADPFSANSTGVLLHPSIGVDYNEAAVIQNHLVRFATVNLAADSQTIRRQLLRVVYSSPLTGVN